MRLFWIGPDDIVVYAQKENEEQDTQSSQTSNAGGCEERNGATSL
jgi:hypothetical protein